MRKRHHLLIGTANETYSLQSMVIKISIKSVMQSLRFCNFGEIMARGKRGRPRAAALRRQRAITASERLTKILEQPWSHSDSTVKEAASQMWLIGRRHRIGLHPSQRIWICRGCRSPLRPGISARVRIRQGRRITTCKQCGRISRRGPDFPREVNE